MPLDIQTVRQLITSRSDALEKAILRIYEGQTSDEKLSDSVCHDNGIGFNGVDAPFMSSLAKQILANKYNRPLGRRLSEKQRAIALKKMPKYAGQIVKMVNGQ